VADVLNRFYTLAGYETFFLTGTDEHGDKIVTAAEEAGYSPQEYVARISGLFRSLWPKLNISNDHFIRTTDPQHQRIVQLILNRVMTNGDIYFSEYEGRYCVGCERFYTERELMDGKCPDHWAEPEMIKEANYFFKMSKYQEWLIDHIRRNPDFIRPERYRNEVLAFLKEPLEDLCISRPRSRLNWGIPLPFDDQFVTYVWFDALINYVSALGYPDAELFGKFWPAAQHIIAKDILKPHGIYWPCMLKSAGIDTYQHLNVHGWWSVNEGKMSKSLGNVVRPLDLVGIYGLDAFRYFLLRDMVFGLDSEFSEEALVARINADLANDLGNLVSRTLSMAQKFFNGVLPDSGPALELEQDLRGSALRLIDEYESLMKDLAFHKALMAIWEVIRKINKYIDTTEPWVLAKSDRERLATVMFHIIETLRVVAALLWPVMPESAVKIQAQLGFARQGRDSRLADLRKWGYEKPRNAISRAPALFPRIESGPKKEATDRKPTKNATRTTGRITLPEFQKMELRVGTILSAEPILKSHKLLKLTVDIGEKRNVVAGLAEHYSAEELPGKQVILLANLEPVRLMGEKSQGMVLAAEDSSGVHLLIPDRVVKSGSEVR
jgi:methionyl-tRNA synthetase